MRKIIIALSLFLSIGCTLLVHADEKADRIAEIRREIKALQKELLELTSQDDSAVLGETETERVFGSEPEGEGLEPGIIYEGNGITISYVGFSKTDSGIDIQLVYENHSGKSLDFMPRSIAVNGKTVIWNFWGYNTVDVADGKKNVDMISCPGIENVYSIDAVYRAFNADYGTEFQTEQFHAGSEGEYKEDGQEIFNDGVIKVSFISQSDATFYFALKNTTSNFYGVDIEDVSVNDFTLNGYDNFKLRYIGALAGCITEFGISFKGQENEELLKSKGINTIERIDFSMDVLMDDLEYDDGSYRTNMMGCEV